MMIAVKVLVRGRGEGQEAEVRELENEISLMRTLDHPNIVRSVRFGIWFGLKLGTVVSARAYSALLEHSDTLSSIS